MSTLNLAAVNATGCLQPISPQRSSFAVHFTPLSVRIHPRLSRSPFKVCCHRSNSRNYDKQDNLMRVNPQLPNPGISLDSFLSPLKATLATTVTAAALLVSQFGFAVKPAVSATVSPPPIVESSAEESVGDEKREASLEERLVSNPNDIDSLKELMEIKVTNKKIPEAIEIIEKLTALEPEDIEWPMLKAHLYAYSGDTELAKNGFAELLKKDPLSVEAYHGLATVASQEESAEDLENVEKKVEEVVNMCKKENKKSDMRDFKLLLAQIRVLEGRYDNALMVYQELVKEEPSDFRPYLCQGIIYTLLKKNTEAEKNFEKYRRLVPKEHPYASYFDDNMMATKLFAQRMEKERAMTKS